MFYSVNVTETLFNDNPFEIIYLFTDISDARDCVFYYDTQHPTVYSCDGVVYHHDDITPDASHYGHVCDVNEHLFPR